MDAAWFKKLQKTKGVTSDDIAARLGRSRTIVSHILNGRQRMSIDWAQAFAEALDVPLEEVLERAGAINKETAAKLRPSLPESDVVPLDTMRGHLDLVTQVILEMAGKARPVSVWRVKSDAMTLAGYKEGDLLLIAETTNDQVRPGDVLVVKSYNRQRNNDSFLLRRYEPPVLVSATTDPAKQRTVIVDGNNVEIEGKVVASWRTLEDRLAS